MRWKKVKNRFYISDTHFGHANILTFEGVEGKPCRVFDSVEEMDETMVERWNAVVGEFDTVYHLGDVAIKKKSLQILERLNGRKILIKGNHDIFKLKDYLPHFKDIRAYVVREKMIFSHIPLHKISMERFKVNVHGHTHTFNIPDPQYINVCVEQINYTPLHHDQIMEMVDKASLSSSGQDIALSRRKQGFESP